MPDSEWDIVGREENSVEGFEKGKERIEKPTEFVTAEPIGNGSAETG